MIKPITIKLILIKSRTAKPVMIKLKKLNK